MNGKKRQRIRLLIQALAAAVMNGYVTGFLKGQIFQGKTKAFCVPVLNCYSCPGALGACPLGSLQSAFAGLGGRLSFYTAGLLMLFGVFLGRVACGFLCPFGLLQDLLHKIPLKKLKVPEKADRVFRYLKYVLLVLFVVLFPLIFRNSFGFGDSWFCKYVCPAGTIEAGVPLALLNPELRDSLGSLFNWKLGLALGLLLLSVTVYRPFCKYLCPLGAFYGLFNRFSLFRMQLSAEKCIGCKTCEKTCPMQVEVTKNVNSAECIRCGRCTGACPSGALSLRFLNLPKESEAGEAKP